MAPRAATRGTQLDKHRPGLDDMTLLAKADNVGITDNLKQRLEARCIYTYIGNVLVAMNPFTWLEIYTPGDAQRYMHVSRLDTPPHVFMIAEAAFRAMSDEEESQCVIISGESGAGKTEASKQIQTYLALCSAGKGSAEVERVKKVFLESNPLLEAFGNAKTLRNNNSSRFGKYFELLFDRFGTPQGGYVTNYLLEKSRTVKPGANERNFHIFYQLVCGCSSKERERLGLKSSPEDYPALATCTSVEGVDDKRDYASTKQAMKDVGLDAVDQEIALKVVAACLALGALKFKPLAVGDAEGSELASDASAALRTVASLLSLDQEAESMLREAFASRKLETMAAGGKTESYAVPLNPTQAALTRDALLKSLFSKMFDRLVLGVNEALDPKADPDGEELLQIGVLDIYGFEIFDQNGFEQLAINFVNEKLQQIFISLTLKAEQEEYVAEGIAWKEVKFFNNKIVCELIEGKKPPGVLLVLDDVCKQMHSRPGAQVDAKFGDTVSSLQGSHAHFSKSKMGFVIKHYAGDVEYSVTGFAQSNRDELRAELLEVVLASDDTVLRGLYEEDRLLKEQQAEEKASGSRSKKSGVTAGRKIREQCGALVSALMMCEPHYVRCVKSNDSKSACKVDEKRVQHQCKYLGLPENVRVRRAGFAYRTEYHRFLERYKTLSAKTYPKEWTGSDKDGAREIVKSATRAGGELSALEDPQQTQFGRTKLFVKKPEVFFALEKLRERKLGDYAGKIARGWRKAFGDRAMLQQQKRVSDAMRGKRRRAASMTRPYKGDYSSSDPLRAGIAAIVAYYKDNGRIVLADDLVSQLVKSEQCWAQRVLVITSTGFAYLIEDGSKAAPLPTADKKKPTKNPRRFRLKRRIELKQQVSSMTVSRAADDLLVLQAREQPTIPANRKQLLATGEWEKNATVKQCPKTGAAFGWFGERRHHCRSTGRIFASEACASKVTLPGKGWFTPVRVADDVLGLDSCDAMEDIVLSSERRSEIVGVLMDEVGLRLTLSDTISLTPTSIPTMGQLPARHLKFQTNPKESEAGPPTAVFDDASLTIQAPKGVSEAQLEDRRKRQEARRKEREVQRRAESERRRVRNAERDAERRAEFRVRLEEKKRRKAETRAERARAAGGSVANIGPRKYGTITSRASQPAVKAAVKAPTRASAPAVVSRVQEPPQRQQQPPPAMLPKPPPQKQPPRAMAEGDYYYQSAVTGEQSGPATWPELKAEFESGNTNPTCLVYGAGVVDEWKKISDCPVLLEFLQQKPPPPQPKPPPPPKQQVQQREAPAPHKLKPASGRQLPVQRASSGADELAAKLARRREKNGGV